MALRNLKNLYREPFDRVAELREKLADLELYARVNGYGDCISLETREAKAGEPAALLVFDETLSDQSTQLVAVVVA